MATSAKSSYEAIRNDILHRRFKPVYLLMGDEAYFIDELTELLIATVLTETEKDFNIAYFLWGGYRRECNHLFGTSFSNDG